MKVVSWNVNGIRSASNKGLLDFMKKESADFFCFQEIKAWENQLDTPLAKPNGYFSYFNEAKKKGYSGVAIYSKQKPLRVLKSLNNERFDGEGRLLILEFPKFTLINVYIPHGGRKKENLDYKLKVYEAFMTRLRKLKQKNVVLVGDFNIAHTEKDLANPKQNINNIMFTPKERQQIDILQKIGFIDTFRTFNKESGHYTWWSYAFNARERNVGWRIDYSFVSTSLKKKVTKSNTYKEVLGSDHCPIVLELAL